MSISKKDVNYLGQLARLELVDDEINILSKQLKDILEYIDKLQKIDVSGVSPTSHPLDLKNVLRQDCPGQSLDKQKALENSPSKSQDFFKIVKVIE